MRATMLGFVDRARDADLLAECLATTRAYLTIHVAIFRIFKAAGVGDPKRQGEVVQVTTGRMDR